MNAVTSTAFLASDPIAASLEALLAHSAPSTPGSVSDNDEVAIPFHLQSIRHGLSEDKGPHAAHMQDAALAIDNLAAAVDSKHTANWPPVTALYAVFDGHGCDGTGSHAAHFAADRLLPFLTNSKHFPQNIPEALRDAFLRIERQYWAAYNSSAAAAAASGGTTALAAVVWGNTLYVANAGDSRAVLSSRGKAIPLTKDHKPEDPVEKQRIESFGGFICPDNRLCGQIGVSRAIGDFQYAAKLKGDPAAGTPGPLSAEPEITQYLLHSKDEFIILGCDGFWDVYKSSQRAVEMARYALMKHNDPQMCAEQLVHDALERHTSDNVTVIVVCLGDEPPKRRLARYGGEFSPSVSSQGLNMLAAALEQHQ